MRYFKNSKLKALLASAALVAFSVLPAWAQSSSTTPDYDLELKQKIEQLTNFPLPENCDTLRILGVGNSFTDDGMMYLPELLEAADIHNVILGRLYIGGCTLQRHCNEYAAGNESYIYSKSTNNEWTVVNEHATMMEGVKDEPWDVMVIQQASGVSGVYDSYMPWIVDLMTILRTECSNPEACIAWQQTWAYWTKSNHAEFPNYGKSQRTMYSMIIDANQKMMADVPISVIIPSGTSIQNLRQEIIEDPEEAKRELTRDGYHLTYKLGRYTAACAWFETLVTPSLGILLMGNEARLAGRKEQLTDKEAVMCHTAAHRAMLRKFGTWFPLNTSEVVIKKPQDKRDMLSHSHPVGTAHPKNEKKK